MISYSRAVEDDIPQILAIQDACGLSPWTEQAYHEAVTDPEWSFLVANDDKTAIAFLLARPITSGFLYEILNIAVLPSYQRQEVGGGLFTEFLNSLSGEIEKVWLEVREGNSIAINFYEKFGFQVVGKRNNFYNNPTENALLMQKTIK